MKKLYQTTEKYKLKIKGPFLLEVSFYEKVKSEELDKIFSDLPLIHTWHLIYENEKEEPFEISYRYLERFNGRRLILYNTLFINDTNTKSEIQHRGGVTVMIWLPYVREVNLNYFRRINSLELTFSVNINSLSIIRLEFLQKLNIEILKINGKRIKQRKLSVMNKLNKIGGLISTNRLLKTT